MDFMIPNANIRFPQKLNNEEINLFLEENDISLYLLEQLSDLNSFLSDSPGNLRVQIHML